MTILIDASQLKYFKQNGQIELESVIPEESLHRISQHFASFSNPRPFKEGFDFWRKEEAFKKDLCSKTHAEILMQLLERPKIRFAFSQYIGPNCQNSEVTLMPRKSCIQHLVGGLCISLCSTENPETPFCSTQKNQVTFFKMDEDFYLRFPKAEGEYIWIFFTEPKAFITHQSEDPLYPFFRSLGYEPGDFLKEALNPSYHWKIR